MQHLKKLSMYRAITNLDGRLKSRDITLLIEFCIVKSMVFLVVMYECESWTIKKAVYVHVCISAIMQNMEGETLYYC